MQRPEHLLRPPQPTGQITIQDVIQMRLAYNEMKETETTKTISEAFDQVVLAFAISLVPNKGN